MNTEQERARAEFEAWANGRCELHLVNPAGRYSSAITQFAWEAWQARAALQAQPQETIAYVTRNEEGDPAMLFFDLNEAKLYCEPGEEPEALVPAGSAPQAAVSVEHATLNLQPVATAFFTEQGEVAYTGIYDRTLKALEAVKTTRMGISCGSIDLYAHPQPAEPVKVPSDVQADAQIADLLEVIEGLERFAEALTKRVRELEALLSAIGAGGVEPLRKTSADTSALRAAQEEAEAALEQDEPLPPPSIHAAAHYGTWLGREAHRHDEPRAGAFKNAARMLAVLDSEVRRLHEELLAAQAQEAAPAAPQPPAVKESLTPETVNQQFTDHFRDATKMMLPTAQNPDDARDAARYRWLRRKVCIVGDSFHVINIKPTYIAPDAAVELDAAIDAAIAAQAVCGGAAS